MEFLAGFFISLWYCFYRFQILKLFLPVRFASRPAAAAEIIFMSTFCEAIIYPEEVTGTISGLIGMAVLVMIFHKCEWHLKLSVVLILYPAVTAVGYLLQDMGQIVWQYGFHTEMSAVGETVLFQTTRILRVIVWYFIYRYLKKWIPQAVGLLTRRMWLVLDLISLSSFVGIIVVVYNTTMERSYIAWPACVTVLIASMGCCYLCTYMGRIVRADMELQTWKYQQSYYEEVENSQQTVRRLRHDMKNHLAVIETFLREKQYDEAEGYLRELDEEFAASVKVYCPNRIVNAVLNAKMQKCEETDISCTYQVDLKESPALKDVELCSLLSNTLDNAIEACQKIRKRSDRRISLKTRCINGHFSYEIINSKVNRVVEEGGNFETDKADRGAHGIGLKNVRQIVNKYGGNLEISHTEEQFSVVILI